MSSILTNNGAMVALQTLKGINASLAKTQDEISTGKSVATAKDNAAVWAISKVMEAEVSGFKAISSGLALAASAVATARDGAESITKLLTEMRDTIVTAQGATSDPAKLQKDLVGLREQIATVVKSAQINGLNLLDGSAGASIDVLSSLDRSAAGVSAGHITVTSHDLSLGAYTPKAAFTGSSGASAAADTAAFFLDAGATGETIVIDGAAGFAVGDSIQITIGGKSASYTFTAEDAAAATPADMAAVGMKNAIDSLGIEGLVVDYDSATPGTLTFDNAAGTGDLSITAQFKNAGAGALGMLGTMSVATPADADAALANIESMMQAAISAAADFGSAGKRLDIQTNFLSKLSDSLKSGMGAMIDADMEEASARLQALQTQQQLGIQSLSIANQAPQSILSLFR